MKLFLSILAAAFSACIYWAINQKPLSESGALLISDPWGIVTLVDLYIGFIIFALFMFFTTTKKSSLIIWIPALMVLGNLVALIYIIFNYTKLTKIFGVQNESK